MTHFTLKSNFSMTGDQPQAVKELVEGFQKGEKRQTLLGVTGSGKSLDYDELIFVKDMNNWIHKVKIGAFVEGKLTKPSKLSGTFYQNISGWKVISFNPLTFEIEEKEISEVSKHIEKDLFEVELDDGSTVAVTKDHNFYRFRDGEFELTDTNDLNFGDSIPIPRTILQNKKKLKYIDLSSHTNTNLSGHNLIKFYDREELLPFFKKHFRAPKWKISQIINLTGSRGLSKDQYQALCNFLKVPFEKGLEKAFFVNKKKDKLCPLLKITDEFLYILGIFFAEGCTSRNYFLISNGQNTIQSRVKKYFKSIGINYYIRNENDICFYSIDFTNFLKHFGEGSRNKCFSSFIFNLSNDQIACVLRGLFDGDGYVETNSVDITLGSINLIYDIKHLLMRFGIIARKRKKSVNNKIFYILSISGQSNLLLFSSKIKFDLPYKQKKLEEIIKKSENTNVDLFPQSAKFFKNFRKSNNLTQKEVASYFGCVRSMVSLIENGEREPSLKSALKFFKQIAGSKSGFSKYALLQKYNFRKVVSIKKKRSKTGHVYDLSIPDNETFCAGNGQMFVHNTFSMANVIAQLNKPVLILTHNKTLTAQLYNEFKDFFPDNAVEYFVSYYDYYQPESYIAASDTYIEKDAQVNEKIEQHRLKATMSLATRKDVIIVSSVSCIYGLGDPDEYKAMSESLTVGQEKSRTALIRAFVKMQYERNDLDLASGKFRVRGDTIDVVPGYSKNIIRFELFGDEIESISEVHPVSAKTLFTYDNYILFPARHFVVPQSKIDKATTRIKDELEDVAPSLGMIEQHRLTTRTKYDLEMIKELGYCSGIENYSRHFDGRKSGDPAFTLLDFFPEDYLIIIDESHVTIPQVHGMHKGDRSRKQSLIDNGFRLPSAYDNRPLTFEEFDAHIDKVLYVSATPSLYEKEISTHIAEQVIRPTGLVDPPIEIRPSEGQMDDLIDEIKKTNEQGFRTFVTTLTKRMAENLSEYLAKKGIAVRYLHSEIETLERTEIIRQLRLGKFDVLVGINLLREGLDVPEVALVAILDADKEGFLRDAKSIIQTSGRAARNIDGRVILYADKITKSIEQATAEISRRREIQLAHNKKHNIIPKTIIKEIKEEVVKLKDTKHIPKSDIPTLIEKLQEEMDEAGENLEFEKAIEIRDRIEAYKARLG
ncbi:MAG: excinuclease ABC B subunit [Candidatus Woesearchaeota archaeon]|jgi:excinuclease ABC B subunit